MPHTKSWYLRLVDVAMRLVCLGVLASGCGSPPPPKPPPAQLEITGPASFAGRWVTADDMDFGYSLEITTEGGYTEVIDRGKLSRCETTGTLVIGTTPRRYTIPQAKVICDGPAASVALDVEITSFTGPQLVVQTMSGGTARKRTYARAPEN